MASTSSLESLAEQSQTLVETVEITPGENQAYGVVTPGEGISGKGQGAHLGFRYFRGNPAGCGT